MTGLNSLVLLVLLAAIFFYILFGVVKAAVKQGMKEAILSRSEPPPLKSGAREQREGDDFFASTCRD